MCLMSFDSALMFRKKPIENIGKGMFLLDELTTKLAMEVILKVTLEAVDGIKAENSLDGLRRKPKSIKSATSLAPEAYLKEQQTKGGSPKKDLLDEGFVMHAASQIRLFLFIGTDTSSSMMVYIYHNLSKHPDWLRQLRNEHNEIFGPGPVDAASLLKDMVILRDEEMA
ncbi:hypothetical protein O1611_g9796 [Lasiodiplodia mahajangana]|uniref:Uncharacterized protein n=1 Tax=Lasiodiplodia mahajangana TaxID=1108764 RepID=A0ACC2J5M4_9PEZI|nr:hypothetical protein O1611_g9796 [Lasiodiplodia mahajangana]